MGVLKSSQKRIIGVFGHHGCGKTTLMDAILKNYSGADRIGQRYLDKEEIEKEKEATFSNHIVSLENSNTRFTFIDTPGSADFIGDIQLALHSVDNVLIVINASAGIEVSTERIWNLARDLNKPVIFFINQLEKEETNFEELVNNLKDKFEDGVKLVPFQVPIGKSSEFQGLVNLLSGKSYYYNESKNGKPEIKDEVDSNAIDLFETYHSELVEDIVENDEELMETFFEEGEEALSKEQLIETLHKAFENDAVVPILIGSAIKNIGIDRLISAFKDFGMSTNERIFKDNDGNEIKPDENEQPYALVIKNDVDPFVGKMTFARIISGKFKSASSVKIVQEDSNEKAAHIYIPEFNKNTEIDEALPGDIVLIPKLKSTKIGQTITMNNNSKIIEIPVFPEPMISKSIQPKSKNEIDKITNALSKLSESDLTFSWEFDPETSETVINGIGSVHLDVMTERLKQNFGVDFDIGKPKIAYRETIRKPTKAEYKHKKQSGGHGQYGHVKIEVEPNERGSGYEFTDKIVGGVIPKNFIPSCDKGIKESMKSGILAGYPVVDVKVTLYDGTYHDVDSSDIAFQIAARTAFKEAMKTGSAVLLEPVMSVEIFVPSDYTGDVMGEVTAKRGRPMGMESTGKGMDKIKAEIPLAEMMDFSPRLNSLSSGKGYFTMKFSNYSEVSPDIQQKIIKEAEQEKED